MFIISLKRAEKFKNFLQKGVINYILGKKHNPYNEIMTSGTNAKHDQEK